MSSISTMTTFGAPAGAFTSKRGGAFASRASSVVIALVAGSWIGSTVRSSLSCAPAGRVNAALTARLRAARMVLVFVMFGCYELGVARSLASTFCAPTPHCWSAVSAVKRERPGRDAGGFRRPCRDGRIRGLAHSVNAREPSRFIRSARSIVIWPSRPVPARVSRRWETAG